MIKSDPLIKIRSYNPLTHIAILGILAYHGICFLYDCNFGRCFPVLRDYAFIFFPYTCVFAEIFEKWSIYGRLYPTPKAPGVQKKQLLR